jgi:3-phosphoshikimate 1-carboxyvinyltransferase
MKRVSDPLAKMGAQIELTEGKLPAIISGAALTGIDYTLPVASAQLKSALLLAGLRANGPTTIIEPAPSRDHTENMLRLLGVDCVSDGARITLTPPADLADGAVGHARNTQSVRSAPAQHHVGAVTAEHDVTSSTAEMPAPVVLRVPGDPSAAAFWCVAAACTKGSGVTVEGINGNPLRCEFINVLQQMGADIRVETTGQTVGEPVLSVHVRSGALNAAHTKPAQSAALMDEYPILSVAAALAEGTSVFEGVGELRVKESDRLAKIVELLNLFGVEAQIHADTLTVKGGTAAKSVEAVTFDPAYDHRMAMCALILARALKRSLYLKDADCITTSFPTFLIDFMRV